MCVGFTSAGRTRDVSVVARARLCLLLLVLAMAQAVDAVEEVHLPLPAPIQGALAAGPYNFQFTGEDNLRLTIVNNCVGTRVAVHYRTAPTPTTTQTNRQEFPATADRLPSTFEFGVGAGYLLNVSIFASAGDPRIGCTHVKLQVIRGFGPAAVVMGTVVMGYVTAQQDLGWPGSPIENSISGGGVVRLVTGTSPAVGVNPSETVPTGARWELICVVAQLVTDAAAGNRRPFIDLRSGGSFVYRGSQPTLISPSNTGVFSWGQGIDGDPGGTFSAAVGPLPVGMALLEGDQILIQWNSAGPGDQWGAPRLYVREWLEVH